MKKTISLLLALLICLSLCSCGVSLTTEQNSAKADADHYLQLLCDKTDVTTYSSKVKEVDGKLIYIGTLNGVSNEETAETVRSVILPYLVYLLDESDMYPVIYLGNEYRILDPRLGSISFD